MAFTNRLTDEVIKVLGVHIKSKMPILNQVLFDWPPANAKLKYPALTIFTGSPTYLPMQAYITSKTDPDVDNKILTTNVVGQYEWNLQLDFWTRNKEERHEIYESFFRAFNSDFVDSISDDLGLSLQLINYHNIFCRYDQVNYDFPDSEESAQRREWRIKVDVLANTKAILIREQFAIIENQVTLEDSTTEIDC